MLTGTWIPQGAEFSGEALPMPASRFVIAEERYVIEGDAGRDEGRLHVDVSVTPHRIDLIGTHGPNAGRTIPALFRLRGNLLQICYAVGEENVPARRPQEISASRGSLQLVVRYRRVVASESA